MKSKKSKLCALLQHHPKRLVSNMENKSSDPKKSNAFAERVLHILAVFALLLILSLMMRNYFDPGYVGCDFPGHIHKIQSIKDDLIDYGKYVDWDDSWYGGYHQFRFYPFISYIPAALFDFIIHDSIFSAKIVVFLSMLSGGIATYFSIFKLLKKDGVASRASGFVAGSLFMLSLGAYSISFIEGEYSDAVAMYLSPVIFLQVVTILDEQDKNRQKKQFVLFSLLFSMLFLMHGQVAIAIAIMLGIYILMNAILGKSRHSEKIALVAKFVLGGAVALGLCAFWWISYFSELNMLANPEAGGGSLTAFSLTLKDLFAKTDNYWNLNYLGILPLILSPFAFVSKKTRKISICLLVCFVAGVLLVLGYNTPIYGKIPIINNIQPEKLIPAAILPPALVSGLGLYVICNKIKEFAADKKFDRRFTHSAQSFLAVAAVVLLVSDCGFAFEYIHSGSPDSALNDVFSYIAQQSGDSKTDRVAFGDVYGMFTSDSPSRTNHSIMNGYALETYHNSWQAELHLNIVDECNSDSVIGDIYSKYNVKYLIASKNDPGFDVIQNDTSAYIPLYTSDPYTVFLYNGTRGFVQEMGTKALFIGKTGGYGYARDSISVLNVIQGKTEYIDDYSANELSQYPAIVLYGAKVHDIETANGLLSGFASEGGLVVMDADDSDIIGQEFLGIKSWSWPFFGEIPVTYSRFSVGFESVNATWEGYPWGVTYYCEGLDENWLILNNTAPVAGIKKIGDGAVLAIGMNFFYHHGYKNCPAEREAIDMWIERAFEWKSPINALALGGGVEYAIDILSTCANITRGNSDFIDDYSADELSGYNTLILRGYHFRSRARAGALLEKFVNDGGYIVADADESDSAGTPLLSASSQYFSINGSFSPTYSKFPLHGNFSDATYGNESWRGIQYADMDEVWLSLEGAYDVAGITRSGKGAVLWVGFNLFFHAAYKSNEAEKMLLQDMAISGFDGISYQNPSGGGVQYDIIEFRPDLKEIVVSLEKPMDVRVSMSWSNHWDAYVNGGQVPVENLGGMIGLSLPSGTNTISLVYVDTMPDHIGRTVSLLSIAFAVAYLFSDKILAQLKKIKLPRLPEDDY